MNQRNIAQHTLTCDIQIQGFEEIERVQFDSLGIHAHSTAVDPRQKKKLLDQKRKAEEQKEESLEDKALGQLGHFGDNLELSVMNLNDKILKKNRLSVVCNVKLEGNHKIVQLESPLVLSNVLSQDIVLGVGKARVNKDDQEGLVVGESEIESMMTIESMQAFPAPLTWFINNQSLYIQKGDNNSWVLVQKNLFETVQSHFSFDTKQAKIYQISQTQNIALNVMAFQCKPKLASTPHQYLFSFDEPVIITNKTFSPLTCAVQQPGNKQEVIAMLKPTESTACYYFNQQEKYDLVWSFLDKENDQFVYQQKNFQCRPGVKDSRTAPFFSTRITDQLQYMCIDQIPIVNKDAEGYDGGEFELRDLAASLISSQQTTFYAKYVLVNRTNSEITCGSKELAQTVSKLDSVYLSAQHEKVKFRVDGYNWSQEINLKTVGVSGELSLEMEGGSKGRGRATASVPYEVAPERLQLGVKIQHCYAPYSLCTKIEIVPRFLVVNQLDFPLVIRQTGTQRCHVFQPHSEVAKKQETLPEPVDLSWVFEKDGKDNAIQIREMTDHEQAESKAEQSVNEELWSPSFPIADLEDFQIAMLGSQAAGADEFEWFAPHPENQNRRFVRIVITTQDEASLLVVFSDPLIPEYSIQNKTNYDVKACQSGIRQAIQFNCPRQKQTAFAYEQRFSKERFIELNIEGVREVVDIERVAKGEPHLTKPQCKVDIGVAVQGSNKTIILQEKGSEKSLESTKLQASALMQLLDQRLQSNICLNLNLEGVSMSLIDNEPKELLLISICDLDFTLRDWNEIRKIDAMVEKNTNININLGHFQIDNMHSETLPVIMSPTKVYVPKSQREELIKSLKEQGKKEEIQIIPFIQVDLTKTSFDDEEYEESTRIKVLEVILQEIQVKVDTAIIDANLKFVNAVVSALSDNKTEFNYVDRHKGIEREQIFDQQKLLLEPKSEVSVDCKALTPLVPKENLMNFEKMYIDFLHLGAIHIVLTFKFEKKAFEFDISNPSGLFGVGNIAQGFFSSVISISNSPLKFTEVIIMDKFISGPALGSQLGKNYAKQGVAQFYKLLGCSDIIGNPVGLIGKVGTGVYEFVSEPTKGLVQGPVAFAEGIGKGFSSLSSNVISGGMESLSNITGSLYSVIKNTTGNSKANLRNADGQGEGVVGGIVGGAQEIGDGVSGFFTKPVEKAKEGGVTGFFKGVGSGTLGLVSAPVTAVLRVGSGVTSGISEATKAKKKDEFGNVIGAVRRFRPPRYISSKAGLTSFDEEMAEAQGILKKVKDGMYFTKSIKAYQEVPRVGYAADAEPNHLIETDLYLVYVDHKKKNVLFVCHVDEIRQADYQEVAERTRVRITVQSSKKQKLELEFADGQIAKVVFDKLAALPQCTAKDHVLGVVHEATV